MEAHVLTSYRSRGGGAVKIGVGAVGATFYEEMSIISIDGAERKNCGSVEVQRDWLTCGRRHDVNRQS